MASAHSIQEDPEWFSLWRTIVVAFAVAVAIKSDWAGLSPIPRSRFV